MRIPLVSSFLPDITQQIHSLRARGVMSAHAAFALGVAVRAFRKSAGTLCIALVAILRWPVLSFIEGTCLR